MRRLALLTRGCTVGMSARSTDGGYAEPRKKLKIWPLRRRLSAADMNHPVPERIIVPSWDRHFDPPYGLAFRPIRATKAPIDKCAIESECAHRMSRTGGSERA